MFDVGIGGVLVKFGVSGEFSLVVVGFWNFAGFTVLILFLFVWFWNLVFGCFWVCDLVFFGVLGPTSGVWVGIRQSFSGIWYFGWTFLG